MINTFIANNDFFSLKQINTSSFSLGNLNMFSYQFSTLDDCYIYMYNVHYFMQLFQMFIYLMYMDPNLFKNIFDLLLMINHLLFL